jgi:hypothetical protein
MQDHFRVGFKGDHDGLASFPGGFRDDLCEYVPMPEMDPIKISDRCNGAFEFIGYLVQVSKYFHRCFPDRFVSPWAR